MKKTRSLLVSCALLGLVLAAGPLRAQDAAHGVAMNAGDMKFVAFPGLPTCSQGAVVSGDPSKGPSFIYAKMKPGCVFPWHWHTPTETLMFVSGEGRAEMKDGKPVMLRAGAFAVMPSKHVHRLTCPKGCTLYVHSDAAFDMHYVDDAGKELTPEDALKKVKETPAKPAA